MKNSTSLRSVLALLALGCAVVLAPVLKADTVTSSVRADMALPVTTSIAKVTGSEAGPFVLTVKNTSAADLKVTAKVLLAVAFHADNKAKHLPEQKIAAGGTWAIADLAAQDKVVLSAEGYTDLTVVVP